MKMKRLAYLILVLTLLLSIVACNDVKDPSADTGNENVPSVNQGYETNADGQLKLVVKTITDGDSYVVVRSESNINKEERAVAEKLHETLQKTFPNISLRISSTVTAKEILIGNTGRAESTALSEGLKATDYAIKLVGEKIVIVGGSTESLETAVDIFTTYLVDKTNKTIKAPVNDGYIYKYTYLYDKISVDGINLSEFAIYNNSLEDAEAYAEKFMPVAGIIPEVANEKKDGAHYIILDGTDLTVDKYSITVEGGNIVIRGSAHSLPVAMDKFLGSYLEDMKAKEINLTSSNNLEASTGKKDIYTKDQLAAVLKQAYDNKDVVIIGEEVQDHNEPHTIANTIKNFEEHSGAKPGMIGVDLACYGIDLMKSDEKLWSSFICDLVDYAAEGGIVTISAHWENPSGNYDSKEANCRGLFGTDDTLEGYQKAFTDLITDGTDYNTFFMKELEANARFLKALKDNGVPVIWRPLHEANGTWFWFCITQNKKTLEASYFTNVWKYVHNYFTNEQGLDNLLWNYGPNLSTNTSDKTGGDMSAMYLYPGDEYCDMVGIDWYTHGELEVAEKNNYKLFLQQSGKLGAINEFGPTGELEGETTEDQASLYNSMDLYEDLEKLIDNGCSFAYILAWGGTDSWTYLGECDEFMNKEMTLGLSDVKAMFDTLK